jgi:hypothetical protein
MKSIAGDAFFAAICGLAFCCQGVLGVILQHSTLMLSAVSPAVKVIRREKASHHWRLAIS